MDTKCILLSCVVCYDDIKNGRDIQAIKCGHVFHQECIDQWFKVRNHMLHNNHVASTAGTPCLPSV